MTPLKLTLGTIACASSGLAFAGIPAPLGTQLGAPLGRVLSNVPLASLPLIEGGMLSVAVIGLVAGIRIIQRKKSRKD